MSIKYFLNYECLVCFGRSSTGISLYFEGCSIEKYLLKMPSNRIWIDYDEDADVLYVSFQKPQHADDSEMNDFEK